MQNKNEFVRVIQENEALIYKVSKVYTNSREDEQDLYQEIVYQLWKSFGSFRQESKLSTWMYRIALNTATNGRYYGVYNHQYRYPVGQDKTKTDYSNKKIDFMEFEEMKSLWEEMSGKFEQQKKLTDLIIIRMTKSDYKNKMMKIFIPELIGALTCFAAVLYILISFQKLDNWYLIACGVVSVFILVLLPVLSFNAIHKIRSVNILNNNYKQSLLEYSKGKRQFVFTQKLSFYLGAVLLLTVLPVMGRLIGGKDLFIETHLWLWYAIGYPFFYGFSKWVFSKYNKTTAEAEEILKELEIG